jgi:hypothetical protein
LRLFPNLDEYYATPQNITEKFWDEQNLSKKFNFGKIKEGRTRNGFYFEDDNQINSVLRPVLSGKDSSFENFNSTDYYWWSTQSQYFENFEEIQKLKMNDWFWLQQILPEYWNLLTKREARSFIDKVKYSTEPFFKFDWMAGMLSNSLFSNYDENVGYQNLMNFDSLMETGSKNQKIKQKI